MSSREQKLEAALSDAIECVEEWAAYASPYFQEKHDLAGDLARLRAVLGEQEATPPEPLAPIDRRGTEGLCKWRLWSLGREYECDLPADHDGGHESRGVPWPDEPTPASAPLGEPEPPERAP